MPSSPITLPTEKILTPDPAGIAAAARAISDGQLLLLPTETVYGIAVNLHSPSAIATIQRFKSESSPSAAIGGDNPPDRGVTGGMPGGANVNLGVSKGGANPTTINFVLHLPDVKSIFEWIPSLGKTARRIIQKSLPGPVAFQISLTPTDQKIARDRLGPAAQILLPSPPPNITTTTNIPTPSLTFRVPDHPLTQRILALIPHPVAIIGAGTPQAPAVFEPSDFPQQFIRDDLINKILDAGPTRYKRPSTLVRIDGDNFSVLRPGVIDERILQKFADFTILFLCSGNTCRSPMASALAAAELARKLNIAPAELPLRHVLIQSAGLHANRGNRATPEAAQAVQALGADLSSHQSQPATLDLLRRADVIYTMTNNHRDEVLQMLPAAASKTHRLDPEADIDDPIGGPLPLYREVANRLQEVIRNLLKELQL